MGLSLAPWSKSSGRDRTSTSPLPWLLIWLKYLVSWLLVSPHLVIDHSLVEQDHVERLSSRCCLWEKVITSSDTFSTYFASCQLRKIMEDMWIHFKLQLWIAHLCFTFLAYHVHTSSSGTLSGRRGTRHYATILSNSTRSSKFSSSKKEYKEMMLSFIAFTKSHPSPVQHCHCDCYSWQEDTPTVMSLMTTGALTTVWKLTQIISIVHACPIGS